MQVDLKIIEDAGQWALVDTVSLVVHTPWIKSSKDAINFADKHYNGWREENHLSVIDSESYKRIHFQKREIPRMMEKKMQLQKCPRTINDLIVFHPIETRVKRSTGETHINYVNDL